MAKKSTPVSWWLMAPFLASIALDYAASGIVTPILPFVAMEYDASLAQIGLLESVISIFGFACGPLATLMCARYCGRTVLLVSVLSTLSFYFLLGVGVVSSLFSLLLARIPSVLLAASMQAAYFHVTSMSTDMIVRTGLLGQCDAASWIGYLLGPLIGSLALRVGSFRFAAYVASVMMGCSAILLGFFVPKIHRPYVEHENSHFFELFRCLSFPREKLRLLIAFWLETLGGLCFCTNFSLFAVQHISSLPYNVSLLSSFRGVAGLLSSTFGIALANRFLGNRRSLLIVPFVMGTSLVGLSFVSSTYLVLCTLGVAEFLKAVLHTTLRSHLSNELSCCSVIESLSRAVSPALGALVLQVGGGGALSGLWSLFVVGAGIVCLNGPTLKKDELYH